MRISEVMTRDPVAIAPERSLREAARLMDDLNVGSLPVQHQGHVVGLLTDRDIVVRAIAAGRDPNVTPVFEVMTEEPHCCFEDEDVSHVVDVMEELQVRRVPVLDRSRRLIGMVALGDLVEDAAPGAEEALGRISSPAKPDRSGMASRGRTQEREARLSDEERRELSRRARRWEGGGSGRDTNSRETFPDRDSRERGFFHDDSGRGPAERYGFDVEDRDGRGIRTVTPPTRHLTQQERDPDYNRRRDQEGQDDPWMSTVRRMHQRRV